MYFSVFSMKMHEKYRFFVRCTKKSKNVLYAPKKLSQLQKTLISDNTLPMFFKELYIMWNSPVTLTVRKIDQNKIK